MKLHADGPVSFEEAEEAYTGLFKSEIFDYLESQSELRRSELYGSLVDAEDFFLDPQDEIVHEVPVSSENAPSTLPQILHLSYKNRGDFVLERLQAHITRTVETPQILSSRDIATAACSALDNYVNALDKDDFDLDLWRRTSLLAKALGSSRIARYCLEAIFDVDNGDMTSLMTLPGLAESLAGQRLYVMVEGLEDALSMIQRPLCNVKRRRLSKMLKYRLESLDTFQSLNALATQCSLATTQSPRTATERIVCKIQNDWADLAETTLKRALADQEGSPHAEQNFAIPTITFDLDDRSEFDGHGSQPSPMEAGISQTVPNPHTFDLEWQFPGLDGGRPTVPLPAFHDISQLSLGHARPRSRSSKEGSTSLPTRKRSSDAAGLLDSQDSGRLKSKRIRARESLVDSGVMQDDDATKAFEAFKHDLVQIQAIDDWAFDTVNNLLGRIGVKGFHFDTQLRMQLHALVKQENSLKNSEQLQHQGMLSCYHLYDSLCNLSDSTSDLILGSNSDTNLTSDASQAGLTSALANVDSAQPDSALKPQLNVKAGLHGFIAQVNQGWLRASDIAYSWVQLFLKPGSKDLSPALGAQSSSYLGHQWPENIKTMIVRVIVSLDASIYRSSSGAVDELRRQMSDSDHNIDPTKIDQDLLGNIEMVQALFELHLDVYSLIKLPNSGVDYLIVTEQKLRLDRWADLAHSAIQSRPDRQSAENPNDQLNLRYLWAATCHVRLSDDVSRSHILDCLNQLRDIFSMDKVPAIELQNNAAMPNLSLQAIDREISKMTTSDFFDKMFAPSQDDPVAVIEALEPLLEYMHEQTPGEPSADSISSAKPSHQSATKLLPPSTKNSPPPVAQELVQFLRASKTTVRLALWQRLRTAYQTIEYTPMVVNCYFRTIEILVSELDFTSEVSVPEEERRHQTLICLQQVYDLLERFLELVKVNDGVFECLDESRLKSIAHALVKILRTLYAADVYCDEVRIELHGPPTTHDGNENTYYAAVMTKLQSLQLNAWVTLYMLLKEAAAQDLASFPNLDEDRMEFLRSLHRAVGMRRYCGGSNRILLNLIKKELSGLKHIDGYDLEFSQVLFDLYKLRCFLNPSYEQLEHDCHCEMMLDRSAAVQAVELLLSQASKLRSADLPKHPIKDAIDKVHGVIARRKPTEAIIRNREAYRTFFKAPINPIDMFRCLSGQGRINIAMVSGSQATLAAKGWYFLMGNIALTKFRSQKRTSPGPTEDLDIAIAFFNQDLEYGAEKWETWFRLGQAYDSRVEDSVTWSAEKLNNQMDELAQIQRSAIHCYRMATAQVATIEATGFETSAKVAELYADFAHRLYSSSRPPFSMQAFSLQDTERYLSTSTIVKVKPFTELRQYSAWKLARTLYQRAIAGNPEKWTLHYMLGKCLWKMHTATEDQVGQSLRPSKRHVIMAFTRAVEAVPREKRDKKEVTLEPHYKLVSIVHKLVMRRSLEPAEACDVLDVSPYARKAEKCHDWEIWECYMLEVLRNLRTADKSNWHHRMIARSARIIYGDGGDSFTAAMGAKHELTQQMFTKTMTIQVWKPEHERPGRHFVFTASYTRFFIQILEELNDRASLEALARRVRRRAGEYYEHLDLWHILSSSYLKALRRYGQIPLGHETSIFSGIDHQLFLDRKEPLEKWCKDPENSDPILDVLRDTLEFKKINQNLMKPGVIDDLIGDAYAYLYDTVGRRLWAAHVQSKRQQEAVEEAKAMERQQEQAAAERKTMMSLNTVMNLDGIDERPMTPQLSAPIAGPSGDATPSTAGDPTQSKRKTGVGRREIRTCAEACLFKTAPAASMPVEPSGSRVRVIIPVRRARSSTSGSVHDSADESELSDVDEELVNEGKKEVDIRPMFPGLRRASETAGSSASAEEELEDDAIDYNMEEDEHGGQEDDGPEDDEQGATSIGGADIEFGREHGVHAGTEDKNTENDG